MKTVMRRLRRRRVRSPLTLAGVLAGALILAPACAEPAPPEAPQPEPAAGPAEAEASPRAAAETDAAAMGSRALPLWEVDHPGGAVYLLGSIHLLRPEVYPLDDAIYEAFEAADRVVLEVDFAEMMAAAPMMMQRGTYQDDTTLSDVVPESVYEETMERLTGFGLPQQVAERMKPWMAALTLSSMVLQQSGYDAASGIDLHFYERAQEGGLEVSGLETMEEQLDVFDNLDRDAQAEMLRSTLEQLDDTTAELDRATELWESGDAEGLAEMFIASMGDQPEVLEALLYQRNRNWIAGIEELIDEGGTAMVIVGVGHLVGDDSLIDLLRARDYQVTQLHALEPAGSM